MNNSNSSKFFLYRLIIDNSGENPSQGEVVEGQFDIKEIVDMFNDGTICENDYLSKDGENWTLLSDSFHFMKALEKSNNGVTNSNVNSNSINITIANPYQNSYQKQIPYPLLNKADIIQQNKINNIQSDKSRFIYIVLGLLLGALGVHNFYIGENNKGIVKLLITFLSFGYLAIISWIIALVDIISDTHDSEGCKLN